MTRAVTITTTTHALAVSIYALQAAQGALYLVGLAEAKTMTVWVGPVVASVWAMVLLVAGCAAVVATRLARESPMPALVAEAWACVALGAASAWYEVTLVVGNGWTEVVTTQSYALMVAVGCFCRLYQIRREHKRVTAALTEPVKTTPVVADEGD